MKGEIENPSSRQTNLVRFRDIPQRSPSHLPRPGLWVAQWVWCPIGWLHPIATCVEMVDRPTRPRIQSTPLFARREHRHRATYLASLGAGISTRLMHATVLQIENSSETRKTRQKGN